MGLRGCQGACQSLGKRKGELHASIHEHGEPVGKVALTEHGRGECGRRNTNSLWSSGDLSLVRGGVWPGPHLASRMASPHGPPVPPSQADAGNFQGLNMGPSGPALGSVPLILGLKARTDWYGERRGQNLETWTCCGRQMDHTATHAYWSPTGWTPGQFCWKL